MHYMQKTLVLIAASVGIGFAASSAHAQLPKTTMQVDHANTALVVINPQVDFLSPKGVTWGLVGKSVEANHTVENLDTLFKAAKDSNMQVVISPHYYHPWTTAGSSAARLKWRCTRSACSTATGP